MRLFGKRSAAPAPSIQETRLDRTQIAAVLSHLEGERDAANARAASEFGLDSLQSWALDLAAGTVTFTTASGRCMGTVEVLGSLNLGANSWMWGWANAGVSDELTTASFGVRQLGEAKGIQTLTTMTLWADQHEAAALAALAFGYADSQFLFATPTEPSLYLAVRDIQNID